MSISFVRLALAAAVSLGLSGFFATPSMAADAGSTRKLDILLSNDDGIGAHNLHALAAGLRKAGHRIAIAAPCHDASGSGGLIHLVRPVPPVDKDCRGGAVKVGSPAYGPVSPGDNSVHYVNGSPLMAAIYGIEVVAPQQWDKGPDLVISGPNEGNNTGLVLTSSGTAAIAAHALQRGIPAIAISADRNSTRNDPAASAAVADAVVALLEQLLADPAPLPTSVGLNINLPKLAGETPAVSLARVGLGTKYLAVFTPDISEDPVGKALKITAKAPAFSVRPVKPRADDEEEAVIGRGLIAVSFIQGGLDADADNRAGIAAWRERLATIAKP